MTFGVLRLLRVANLGLAVVGAATLAAPVGLALREVGALRDPVARADLQLDRELTAARMSAELLVALDSGDADLGASFVELAQERGLAVSAAQKDRLDEIRKDRFPVRAAQEFGAGFLEGDMNSGLAMSGAIAADLSGFGDLRELAREGGKWAAGATVDPLVIGLSAAGLALTAATWSSLGALPARGGLSFIKAMQRTGRLSKPLVVEMSRVAHGAVDSGALKASLVAIGRFDLAAARQAGATVMEPQALAGFRAFGSDVSVIYGRAGARGAQDVLATAATRAEVREAATIATAKGSKTRAILRVLGRGVLMAGTLSLMALGWLFAAVAYFFAVASLARSLGETIGRGLWSGVACLWRRRISMAARRPARAIMSAPAADG